MRRKDRELNKNEALKIIDECEYAVISCAKAKIIKPSEILV